MYGHWCSCQKQTFSLKFTGQVVCPNQSNEDVLSQPVRDTVTMYSAYSKQLHVHTCLYSPNKSRLTLSSCGSGRRPSTSFFFLPFNENALNAGTTMAMLSILGRYRLPIQWQALSRHFSAKTPSISSRLEAKFKDILPEEKKEEDKKPENRWQRLKRERREAPPPKHRSNYKFHTSSRYDLPAALTHVRQSAWASFDESLELVFRLNVDPRHADHNLRGTIHLPHGTGRNDRVAVIAPEENDDVAKLAREAGAHLVGGDSLIERVREERGKCIKGFSACLTTPEMLPTIAQKIGPILGPKGLMPNAKLGTVVTNNVGDVVRQFLRGAITYRVEKAGNMMMNVGKLSFTDQQLSDNVNAAVRAIWEIKPVSVKRGYFQKISVCSSMGPAVLLSHDHLMKQIFIDS